MSNAREGMPGNLWTPPGERRGVLHDRNAFLRMKKKVEAVIDCFGMAVTHRVSKALYDDDAIVIHGLRSMFTAPDYYLPGGAVDETVFHALESNGIEFKRGPAVSGGSCYCLIPIDQDACPQPMKRKKKLL